MFTLDGRERRMIVGVRHWNEFSISNFAASSLTEKERLASKAVIQESGRGSTITTELRSGKIEANSPASRPLRGRLQFHKKKLE